jgi:fructoselysine-6-P-deglycase FrlB-like protein
MPKYAPREKDLSSRDVVSRAEAIEIREGRGVGENDTTPNRLAALPPDHPETDAICLVQSFYVMVVRLSAARGTDADQPRHLQKITRTR